jgi:hypothetical protein
MIKPSSALLAVLLIAAAPPPAADHRPDDVVRALLRQDDEVASIGYRLVTANAASCARQVFETGMTIGTLAQYDQRYRASAARVLGMTAAPTVELVVPGSPADRAGVEAGDVLIAADGVSFAPAAPSRSGRGSFAAVDAAMTALDAALADGRADLTVERDGRRIAIGLTGATACRSRFQVAGDDLDAFVTDSIWIKLSPQLIDFAGTPDALAAAMAHELAHNVLGHGEAKGAARRLQELQADRLMPWLMARAGFDPDAAVTLWRRFEAKRLGGLLSDGTHPGWRERVAAVVAERARIADLASRGGTIVPPDDLKPR